MDDAAITMDLDTSPSEMLLSPSISLSTSRSSSTSDVFSLLLNQVQQCHTQQITELEQKLVHLTRKYRKLVNTVKERGEIAVKYRQKYHQLQEENRNLKKWIKRQHYGTSAATNHALVAPSLSVQPPPLSVQHPAGAEFHHESSRQTEENTKHSWTSDVNIALADCSKETDRSPTTVTDVRTPDGSKKKRLALKKRNNKKVKYREVNPNLERNRKAEKENRSNSILEEILFVPETMDPDLYQNEDDDANDDDDVVVEDDAAADATTEGSKVILHNSSTPLLVAHVSPPRRNNFTEGEDTAAMSPIGRSLNLQSDDVHTENHSPDDVELDACSDSLKMSPTFTGDKTLGSRTSPGGFVNGTAVYKQRQLSNMGALDHTSESEASYLLLPQGNSTPSQTQDHEKNPPLSKRRSSSPIESNGKRFRTSPTSEGKCGFVKYVTFSSDTKHLDEQKSQRQSTLSQHLVPLRKESKQRSEVKIIGNEDFRVPDVPDTADKRKRSLKSESITELEKNDETNISLSLIDPIIDLDDFERDSESPKVDSSQQNSPPGQSRERQKECNGGKAKRTSSVESRIDKDKSDLMFDDVDFDVEKKTNKEDDQDGICEIVKDFDRVPRKDGSPQFKHKEVVRKHNEREKLKGFECKQCAEFYNGMQLTDTQKEERMTACSRHRGRYTPPSTPEHYWSVDFPDTPTCLQRGYIQQDDNIKVDANVMPRRRNRLKQLFPTKT